MSTATCPACNAPLAGDFITACFSHVAASPPCEPLLSALLDADAPSAVGGALDLTASPSPRGSPPAAALARAEDNALTSRRVPEEESSAAPAEDGALMSRCAPEELASLDEASSLAPAEDSWLPSMPVSEELASLDDESVRKLDAVGAHCEASGEPFTDADFPPDASSIDGRRKPPQHVMSSSSPPRAAPRPLLDAARCRCGAAAKLCSVSKDGPNQGRAFYGCAVADADARCGFFAWADDAPPSERDAATEWRRFTAARDGAVVARAARGFRAADVRQGGVGDCWFLAALAVVAERPELIARNVFVRIGDGGGGGGGARGADAAACDTTGAYALRLFLDGAWRVVLVDNHFATRAPKQPSTIADGAPKPAEKKKPRPAVVAPGETLAFARAADAQLWVPLLEKAYAKAHGSYAAISGGWIAEALFDLTAGATESLWFRARGFDADETWARLLSFKSAGHLFGAICPRSADGLVGCHAYVRDVASSHSPSLREFDHSTVLVSPLRYSVLDLRELTGVVIGRQTKIDRFFAPRPSDASGDGAVATDAKGKRPAADANEQPVGDDDADPADGLLTRDGVLRMVRLRNPWGKREWSGAFGAKAEQWTARLRRELGQSDDNDGTFWMPWPAVVEHFEGVDVCKPRLDWHTWSFESRVPAGGWAAASAFELRAREPTLACLTLAQPSKRAHARSSFWYSDLSLVVARVEATGARGVRVLETVGVRLSGECPRPYTRRRI